MEVCSNKYCWRVAGRRMIQLILEKKMAKTRAHMKEKSQGCGSDECDTSVDKREDFNFSFLVSPCSYSIVILFCVGIRDDYTYKRGFKYYNWRRLTYGLPF